VGGGVGVEEWVLWLGLVFVDGGRRVYTAGDNERTAAGGT
jgi:L-ascorbate metabolism protein UlaG (beta-lactamase superfamily)